MAAGEGDGGDHRWRRRHPDDVRKGTRRLVGVECVIDKDRATALLAREIGASVFVCATDADAVYLDWGKPAARAIRWATPDAMDAHRFPAGSMGPKVEAAQDFARLTGGRSVICALADVAAAVRGERGTTIGDDPSDDVGDDAGDGIAFH